MRRKLEYWRFNYRLGSYYTPSWPQHVVPDNCKYDWTADIGVGVFQIEIYTRTVRSIIKTTDKLHFGQPENTFHRIRYSNTLEVLKKS